MLSQIYRISADFEHNHGVAPNLLYLNYRHFELLKQSFDGLDSIEKLLSHLNMQIILMRDALHPRVAWSSVRNRAV